MVANFYERLKKVREGAGQPESAEAETVVRDVVQALLSQPTDARRPGMLLGKIQSGKTRSFLGIIMSAFDAGFHVAIVLTKGTRTLAKQTVNRISKEYSVFRDAEQLAVYDIMSIPNLTEWEIEDQKLVFVAKKEHNNMRRLIKLFRKRTPHWPRSEFSLLMMRLTSLQSALLRRRKHTRWAKVELPTKSTSYGAYLRNQPSSR
jgi:hypothetical protein